MPYHVNWGPLMRIGLRLPKRWRESLYRSLIKHPGRRMSALIYHPGYINPKAWHYHLTNSKRRGIPFRQSQAMLSLERLVAFNDYIGATTILRQGALLGAVRQGAFAGRPSDIDVGVLFPKGCQAYVDLLELDGKRFGLRSKRHKQTRLGPAKIKMRCTANIDLRILDYQDTSTPTALYEVCNHTESSAQQYDWPGLQKALRARIFDCHFFIPNNYRALLEELYGPEWHKPDKRQVHWREPDICRPAEAQG